jgi:hypothetical protein
MIGEAGESPTLARDFRHAFATFFYVLIIPNACHRLRLLGFHLPALLLIVIGSSPAVFAQTSGTITGTVHDPQNAMASKASTTATHIGTAASRSVISDSAGGSVY